VQVRFGKDKNQRSHTFRYVVDAGLDSLAVQQAIERDLKLIPLLDGLNKGKLEHSGKVLHYHAFKFPDGTIMWDGSPSPVQHPPRPLRTDERELVQALLSGAFSHSEIEHRLAHALVQDMSDGGMGSIRFAKPISTHRRLGREASLAEYIDQDGVPVSITLNLLEPRPGGQFV
jgi:hypothetical protein